jgi:hypothetical protein
MEKRMSRYASLASLIMASTFAFQGSAAFAAQAERTQHNPPSPANIVQPASGKSHRADQKKMQPPASRSVSVSPRMYPPGPSGHEAPPSSGFGD